MNSPKNLGPDVTVELSRHEQKKPIQLMSISYLNIPAFSTTDSIVKNTRIGIRKEVKKHVKTTPKFALLFTDNFDVSKLKNTLPCDTLILTFPNLIIQSHYSNSLIFEEIGKKPRIMANSLLLVGDKYLKIKYDFHYLDDTDVNDFVKRLLSTEGDKQTLILFGSGCPFNSLDEAKQIRALVDKALDLIHESCRRTHYTCWGGEARMFLNDAQMTSRSNQPFIFGLNIYGSTVESYSAIIDTENTEDFIRQASFIKQGITFKRYSIGFVNTTKEVADRGYYLNCVELLKKMFSETTFTCLSRFQESIDPVTVLNRVLGYDSHNSDAKPLMEIDCLMSLLIITFDRSNYSGSEDFQLVNDDGEIEGSFDAGISNSEKPANTNCTPPKKENASKIEKKVSDVRLLIEKKNEVKGKEADKNIQAIKANKKEQKNKIKCHKNKAT